MTHRIIPPAEAKTLRGAATDGPWAVDSESALRSNGKDYLLDADRDGCGTFDEIADATLAAAAPDLAYTVEACSWHATGMADTLRILANADSPPSPTALRRIACWVERGPDEMVMRLRQESCLPVGDMIPAEDEPEPATRNSITRGCWSCARWAHGLCRHSGDNGEQVQAWLDANFHAVNEDDPDVPFVRLNADGCPGWTEEEPERAALAAKGNA